MQLINELECFKRAILVTNFLILGHKNLMAHKKNLMGQTMRLK